MTPKETTPGDGKLGAPDRVLVIADDLTGTLDSLSSLAGLVPVEIRFTDGGLKADGGAGPEPVGVGIDTETRHATPAAAAAAVAREARWGCENGFGVIFKKTDSTLRGNVGAELQGMWKGAGSPGPVYFVPAFPEAGRTLQNGILYVNGRPVSETSLAQDPRSPVTQSSIRTLLRPWFGDGVRVLAPEEIGEAAGAGKQECVVFESTRPEDIEAAVDWLRRQQRRPLLLAGCGGLGRRLPSLLGLTSGSPAAPLKYPEGPALVVHGSITPVSTNQLKRALARGAAAIPVAPERVRVSNREVEAFIEDAVATIVTNMGRGKSILMHTAVPEGVRPEAVDGMAALSLMGRIAASALRSCTVSTLFLSGGETAHAVLTAAHCPGGELLGELHPGVNRMRAVAGGWPLDIITKSGGFGPPEIYDPYFS